MELSTEDKTRFKIDNEFQLKVLIPTYDVRSNSRGEEIIYTILLQSNFTNTEWSIKKSYTEFEELNCVLSLYFVKVPFFPKRSQDDRKTRELEVRKTILERFLKDLIRRPDFLNSIYLKNFLEIEKHCPDFRLFQPLMLFELFDLPHDISCFTFSKRNNLIFIGLGNKSITSKITNMLNISLPWDKKKDNSLGGLSINHMSKNHRGEVHVEQIKYISYMSYVNCINYLDSHNLLSVGLGNGNIYIYKIFESDQRGRRTEFLEEISVIKAHNNPVISIGIQYSSGYVFSCSKDKVLVVSEMNYKSVMKVFDVSTKEISSMVYDNEFQRVYITDIGGSIWIISVKNIPPIILQANHSAIQGICTLDLDFDKNFIFVGNNKGRVQFYEYDDTNIYNISINKKLEIMTDMNLKIKKIHYKINKSSLIISLSNGSVAIYSHDSEYPEFILDGHEKEITDSFWDEENKILMTSANDKRLKIWQLPVTWPSEILRVDKEFNDKYIISDNSIHNSNIMKIKNAFSNDLFNDDNQQFNDQPKDIVFNDSKQNDSTLFDNLENVFSKTDSKRKLKIVEIKKDDLLGWDL